MKFILKYKRQIIVIVIVIVFIVLAIYFRTIYFLFAALFSSFFGLQKKYDKLNADKEAIIKEGKRKADAIKKSDYHIMSNAIDDFIKSEREKERSR